MTYLEQWLQTQHRRDLSYTGSFIAHYATRLVYLRVSSLIVLALTLAICTGTAYIYIAGTPPRSRQP